MISKQCLKFYQNNMYIDFFIKKIVELLLKNFLVLGALFFSEKFIIEHFTKKVFNSYLFILNKFSNFLNMCSNSVFYYIAIAVTNLIFFLEIYIFLC